MVRFASFLLLLALAAPTRADEARQCPAVGQKAPPFALLLGDGTIGVSLPAALRKHLPVVVNFWRYDCRPCLKELPAFQQVAKELTGKVTFLLVHVGDDEAQMIQALQKLGVSLKAAADLNREVAGTYCVGDAIPRTFVIDAKGEIRALLPTVDAATLRRELKPLIAAAP